MILWMPPKITAHEEKMSVRSLSQREPRASFSTILSRIAESLRHPGYTVKTTTPCFSSPSQPTINTTGG